MQSIDSAAPADWATEVVAPVGVPFMGHIELFNHLPGLLLSLLLLTPIWNYTVVYKLFVLDKNTW